MNEQRCRCCEAAISPGSLYYYVTLTVVSGFDGVVGGDDDFLIDSALEKIAERDERALNQEVFFEEDVLLCPSCKGKVITLFLQTAHGEHNDPSGNSEVGLH